MLGKPNHLRQICSNCGLTQGSHSAASYYSDHYQMFIPYNYCPGDEGRMNWDKGPGTVFEPTGLYKKKETNYVPRKSSTTKTSE